MIKECLDEQGLLRLLELIKTELSKYVKSVEGKGLSTNDFTTELLNKLNDIDPEAIGLPGYTPQKGIDYWTEEDKAEIIQLVLASIPDGDEVSY